MVSQWHGFPAADWSLLTGVQTLPDVQLVNDLVHPLHLLFLWPLVWQPQHGCELPEKGQCHNLRMLSLMAAHL